MTDLLVKNCLLLQKKAPQDILIKEGVIKDIASKITLDNIPIIDADFHFVTPPFVDSHFHMDATLSYGLPRVNKSGTLLEGIKLWGELKPNLTADAIKERALKFCKWAIARGTLAIRSHVDVSGQNLVGVEALLDVRETMKDFIDIQLVAFPQDGLLRANCLDNLNTALDMGVDVVGGIPHFERTMGRVMSPFVYCVRLPKSVDFLQICIVMKQMTQCQGMLRSLHWKLLDLV